MLESTSYRFYHRPIFFCIDEISIEEYTNMHEDLNYIINHIFLPLKLPQEDDSDAKKDAAIIKELLVALRLFQAHMPEGQRSQWSPCINMISTMLKLRDHLGELMPKRVESALKRMMNGGMNELI